MLELTLSRRRSLGILSAGLAGAAAAANEPQDRLRLPRKIRVALIGLDGHPGEILNPLPRLPDVEVVAFADRSAEARARAVKNPRLASARLYGNYDEMLRTEDKLDVLAVCNNNAERAGAVLAGLRRGLHVIAEKPLALRRNDLKAIRDEQAQRKARMSMLLPMRFSPPYLAIKQIAASGPLGDVVQIAAQKSYKLGARPEWMLKRATYGGTIAWIGIHMIDLMRWSSSREMTDVVSYQTRIGAVDAGEMETVTTSMFRLDNGGLATLRMDYMRPPGAPGHGDDRLRLAGTKGIAEYQAATGVTLMAGSRPTETVSELPKPGSVFIDFLNSVYNDKPPLLPVEDIFRVTEITIAAQESADEQRPVRI